MNNPGSLQHCSLSSRQGLNESNDVRSTLECVWQQPPPSARDSIRDSHEGKAVAAATRTPRCFPRAHVKMRAK